MLEIIPQEQLLIHQGLIYCGVDEAGAGPLCGDVVAAAVILDPQNSIQALNDSKKLSEKKREALFPEIMEKALAFCVARASVDEIDEINILHARMLAMTRAINGLSVKPDHALIDGNRLPLNMCCEGTAIIKGDALVQAISAASVLAKVTRDHDMFEMDKLYPMYGLAKHKGYPTKAHIEALQLYGLHKGGSYEIYRKTYGPVKKIIAQGL
jgi:ribonuclease HII